jgi:hypothetical protein
MEFYYMINYYFKYLELLDTVFLAFKKKPLREFFQASDARVISYSDRVLTRLPPCCHGLTLLLSVEWQD